VKPSSEAIAWFRETLLNKTEMLTLLYELIDEKLADLPIPDSDTLGASKSEWEMFISLASYLYKLLAETNTNIIFSRSESQIETIFLNSLNWGSFMHGISEVGAPLLTFVDSKSNAEEYAHKQRTYIRSVREARHMIRNELGIDSPYDFIELVTRDKLKTEEDKKIEATMILLQDDMQLGSTFQLMPQAPFPGIIVDGKSIRVDAYIWDPEDDEYGLVLECDGYEFHSEKQTFKRDRKRDRQIGSSGLRVLRFSGSEIYNSPIEVAAEIIKELRLQRGYAAE